MACIECRPIPHTTFCFACGRDVLKAQRSQCRYEVSVSGENQSQLGKIVAGLSGDPEAMLRPTVDLGRFDLVADLMDGENERFEAIVASSGATIARTVRVSVAESQTRRFVWTTSILTKIGVVALVGGAAYALGVPLVSVVSVPVSLALVFRASETVAHEVRIARPALERTLGVMDQSVLAEVRVARSRLTQPESLGHTVACINKVADVTWLLSGDAVHLPHLDLTRVRATLSQLVRQTLRIAVVADALCASSRNPDAERLENAREAALSQLKTTEAKLVELHARLLEGVRTNFQREALAEPLRLISQVQREIDEAVDVAESLYEVDADCRSVLAER